MNYVFVALLFVPFGETAWSAPKEVSKKGWEFYVDIFVGDVPKKNFENLSQNRRLVLFAINGRDSAGAPVSVTANLGEKKISLTPNGDGATFWKPVPFSEANLKPWGILWSDGFAAKTHELKTDLIPKTSFHLSKLEKKGNHINIRWSQLDWKSWRDGQIRIHDLENKRIKSEKIDLKKQSHKLDISGLGDKFYLRFLFFYYSKDQKKLARINMYRKVGF